MFYQGLSLLSFQKEMREMHSAFSLLKSCSLVPLWRLATCRVDSSGPFNQTVHSSNAAMGWQIDIILSQKIAVRLGPMSRKAGCPLMKQHLSCWNHLLHTERYKGCRSWPDFVWLFVSVGQISCQTCSWYWNDHIYRYLNLPISSTNGLIN